MIDVGTIKDLVILVIAIYTAWWAYKSFAYKDQIGEIKELLVVVEKIKQEAFFRLVVKAVDGNKKSDLGDLMSLIFEMRVKFNSALYINDEILNQFRDLDNYISNEVFFKVNYSDSEQVKELRNNFTIKYDELRDLIIKKIKHYK